MRKINERGTNIKVKDYHRLLIIQDYFQRKRKFLEKENIDKHDLYRIGNFIDVVKKYKPTKK